VRFSPTRLLYVEVVHRDFHPIKVVIGVEKAPTCPLSLWVGCRVGVPSDHLRLKGRGSFEIGNLMIKSKSNENYLLIYIFFFHAKYIVKGDLATR
jgi:hypothetical protein